MTTRHGRSQRCIQVGPVELQATGLKSLWFVDFGRAMLVEVYSLG
jgi:hypothetical protein